VADWISKPIPATTTIAPNALHCPTTSMSAYHVMNQGKQPALNAEQNLNSMMDRIIKTSKPVEEGFSHLYDSNNVLYIAI
jgi:hypothetical protein